MRKPFASLCILAYKRPELLQQCLISLYETVDFPSEIIINFDGTDSLDFPREFKFSKIIVNKGNNRGVGRSFQNCLGVAEGDYVFKLDADLIFKPGWLSKSIKILDTNEEIGAVGLFDYNRQDPNDDRFKPENNIIRTMKTWDFEYQVVKDFVSCGYGFRRKDLNQTDIPDDGLHQSFGQLAIHDSVDNKSFGFDSVYVQIKPDGSVDKTPTFDMPLLFGEK